jgi:hypothetical protein
MNRTATRSSFVYASALAALFLSLSACVASTDDVDELAGAPEEGVGTNEGGVTGSLTVGSTLIATTDVNLRATASTSATILAVVPSGASVTVQASAPSNGFYKVKYNGLVGWSFGNYYKAAAPPPVSSGPQTAPADLVALLSSCQQLSGTTSFRTDEGAAKTVPICQLNGAVWWKADMDIDCDGGKGTACKSDPYYQADTAAVDSSGNALDASTLPYVVVPLPSNGFDYKAAGLKLGSVVGVIYQGKIMYGIIGDLGPTGVIGEASYAMASKLGINPSPISGGVDSGVTYVAFTGSSAVVTKKEDAAQAAQIGQARTAAVVAAN